MALYTTIHLHNVPADKMADYAAWFDGPHREALARLRGFKAADRFEITEQQLGDAFQPWQFLSVYDFDYTTPEIDLPALGPLLADARDAGLITPNESERIHSYRLYGDWKGSPNWQRDKPLSGVSVLLGNYVAGRFEEYQTWYENVHSVEVANVPGHVAMKRGELSNLQVEPRCYCPGDQLVMTAQQTDDLAFTIGDFVARALGHSPSGIAMEPRSSAGSLARTVHYFKKISGTQFWDGGIAYGGDLSVYPDKA
ncbi:hypothetical protein [Novosphingobium sp. MMS21-SN21R]|uniref:hypothetical protein n=1 Tax=Novosphingobium sp. MMS21-SN21R TaxID=2969298 RepID=UPI002883D2D0|nr:hypothetical protein [Novosphingobium sp. MMS21-SN21R]MDT0509800.1 hypothetical protein [Novosphingobium sp. MMS21-SN21R]